MKFTAKKYFVLFILLVLENVSFGQNFVDAYRLINSGVLSNAANLGMGNATMAVFTGYGNYLTNPAVLGKAANSELVLSYYYDQQKNTSTFFGSSLSDNQSSNNVNEFGMLYKVPTVQGSFVIGFGYHNVKDFNSINTFSGFNSGNNSLIQDLTSRNSDLTYDLRLSHSVFDQDGNYLYDETFIDGMLQQSGKIRESGTLSNWALFTSVEVDKDLFLGGSLNLYGGNYSNDREYSEYDSKNNYGDNLQIDPDDPLTIDFREFYMNDNIKWDLSAWNFTGGFFYNFKNFIRFAGTVETPVYYKIKEAYFVRGSSYFKNDYGYDVQPQQSNSEYEIKTPVKVGFGLSINTKILEVSAQAHISDYTQTEFTKGFSNAVLSDLNKEIKDNFKAAPDFQAGAVIHLPEIDIDLRAGGMYFVSPYKNDTKENDRKYLTAGVGFFRHKSFSFDIAALYGFWKDYTDIYGNGEARIYRDVKDYRATLTMTYRF